MRLNRGEIEKILWDNGQEDWREVVFGPTPVRKIEEDRDGPKKGVDRGKKEEGKTGAD